MVSKSRWLPPGVGGRGDRSGAREPGAEHDHMSREYLEGPAATPLGDVCGGILLVAGAVLVVVIPLGLIDGLNLGALIVMIAAALVFLGGAVFAIRRGLRRWRWRRLNVDRTGGVYLRPWQRTPSAYRGERR